jgi:hypothetical protein
MIFFIYESSRFSRNFRQFNFWHRYYSIFEIFKNATILKRKIIFIYTLVAFQSIDFLYFPKLDAFVVHWGAFGWLGVSWNGLECVHLVWSTFLHIHSASICTSTEFTPTASKHFDTSTVQMYNMRIYNFNFLRNFHCSRIC